MIGTTRRVDAVTNTIVFSKPLTNSKREPMPNVPENVIFRIHPHKESGKLVFQIGTSDPDKAVEAARLVAGDVAGIDVNAGCPKPFSTLGGMGAALLRTPDRLCAILEALVKNIMPEYQIGISVKIRLLETAAETEALVRKLVATGITGLTIHCRTTPMRPREAAIRGQLRMIADICREAGVACLMNGDVEDRDQALRLAGEFGADGAMIATAAEKNPSCFRSQAEGGLAPWNEVVDIYMKYAMDVENRFGNTKHMLAQLIPGKAKKHGQLTQCKSYSQICQLLGLDSLLERARQMDLALNIDPDGNRPKAGKKANNSALAAGGNMAEARVSQQHRKTASQRGVSGSDENTVAAVALPT
jgi:tRNA-dihydrouridine synthase 2